MKRDEVRQLVERGIRELNEALANGKSDRLQLYLDVMARFPRYSFNNCILIAVQFPDASVVQGFHGWKKLGRSVKKGAKGIGIIAPMAYRASEDGDDAEQDDQKMIRGFKVVHVFDVSQTDGKDLPELAKVTGDPGPHIVAVEDLIRSKGIELVYESIPGGAEGLSKKGTIVITPDLEPAKRLVVLIHELAHEWMHWEQERRESTTKATRETEAEAVAHVVGRALGLESVEHCADYIHLHNGDVSVLAKSMDHIQKSAARILEAIQSRTASSVLQTEEVAA